MREKFARYNLEIEEVLIGTPTSSEGDSKIEQILTQLRARQIAEEQIETHARQEKAAVKERVEMPYIEYRSPRDGRGTHDSVVEPLPTVEQGLRASSSQEQ